MAEEYQDRIMRMAANAARRRGLFGDLNQMGRDLSGLSGGFPTNGPINYRENYISSRGRDATIQGIIQNNKNQQQRWENLGGENAYPTINKSPGAGTTSPMLQPGWLEAQSKWKDNIPLMLRSLRQRDEFKDWSDDELRHYMYRTFSNRGGLMSLV